jgi:hypothetical protein
MGTATTSPMNMAAVVEPPRRNPVLITTGVKPKVTAV